MWIMAIVLLITFIAWALTMHMFKETNKALDEMKKKSIKLMNEATELEVENRRLNRRVNLSKNIPSFNDHYVVELNKGTYLSNRTTHVGGFGTSIETTEHYQYTRDIRQATTFREFKNAKKYAEDCGGRVLHNKPVLEVVG